MSTHEHNDAHHPTSYLPPGPTSPTQVPSHSHSHGYGSKSPPQHHDLHVPTFTLGQDVDLAIGVTASALTVNELFRATGSKDHTAEHLLKAGLGVVAAVAAFGMMKREHDEERRHNLHENEHGRPQEHEKAHRRGRENSRTHGTDVSRSRHDEVSHANLAKHDANTIAREREERRGDNEHHEMTQRRASIGEERERRDVDRYTAKQDDRSSSVEDSSALRRESDKRHRSPSPSPSVRRHRPGWAD